MTILPRAAVEELTLQLTIEKAKYHNAIKSNETFETLKQIKLRIKQLEYNLTTTLLSN